MTFHSRERVLDWQDELERVAPRLYDLPDAARKAVFATVEAFLAEDAARSYTDVAAPRRGEQQRFAGAA